MLITRSGFRIFTEYDLDENLDRFLSNIQKEIGLDRNILSQDEKEYAARKLQQYSIKPLTVFPDKIRVSQQEVDIDARFFPGNFFVDEGESYPKPVITFYLPFEGDQNFLRCRPSTFVVSSEEVSVSGGEIIFEIINFDNNAEEMQKKKNDVVSLIQTQIQNVNNQINAYNAKLPSHIADSIKKSKEKMNIQDDLLSKLGNPIKPNHE